MVREDRPAVDAVADALARSRACDVGVSPSSPWFNSGGPPQFVKTHGATHGQQGAEPEAKNHYGDIMDALHAKDHDAVMNAVTALLTAPRAIGTSSLDDASAPSKAGGAAAWSLALLDDARVASKFLAGPGGRTTSRLGLARGAAGWGAAFSARRAPAGVLYRRRRSALLMVRGRSLRGRRHARKRRRRRRVYWWNTGARRRRARAAP